MNIKRTLVKGGLALAVAMASAVPALPNELSFNFSSSPIGTVTTSGGQLAAGTAITGISGWTDYTPGFVTVAGGTVASTAGDTFEIYLSAVNSGVDTFVLYQTGGTNIAGATTKTNPLLSFTAETTLSGSSVTFNTAYAGIATSTDTAFLTAEQIANNSSFTELSGNGMTLSGSNIQSATFTPTFSATPEPSSFALIGLGIIGLGVVKRRYSSRAKQAV